jgi:hypothetical protein
MNTPNSNALRAENGGSPFPPIGCGECACSEAGGVEVARLREEMHTVAAGLDLLIAGGCDQASSLARLRDHLRREADA